LGKKSLKKQLGSFPKGKKKRETFRNYREKKYLKRRAEKQVKKKAKVEEKSSGDAPSQKKKGPIKRRKSRNEEGRAKLRQNSAEKKPSAESAPEQRRKCSGQTKVEGGCWEKSCADRGL